MRLTTMQLLSLVVSPEDRDEFEKIVVRFGGAAPLAQVDQTTLDAVRVKAITPIQRLLIGTYAHLYAALRARNLRDDPQLAHFRSVLRIAPAFAAHVRNCLGFLDKTKFQANGGPIEIVMNPPQEVGDWANKVVYAAHRDGFYIEKVRLHGLVSADYEHPLDRQYLDSLRRTPGLETLVRKVYDWGWEPLLKVQHTGSNIKVTADCFPQVFKALTTACEVLDLSPMPDVYIKTGFINAWTAGAHRPIIVLLSGCFGTLTYDELLFLIGHEVGHIKSQHCLYRGVGSILPGIGGVLGAVTMGIGGLVLSAGLELQLFQWKRMSEFTADRAGLLCCQNLDAAVTVMMKLSGAPPRFYRQLNPEHFLRQAREFEGFDMDGKEKALKVLGIIGEDHPWTVMRAKELDTWFSSGSFDRIVAERSAQATASPGTEQTTPKQPPPLPKVVPVVDPEAHPQVETPTSSSPAPATATPLQGLPLRITRVSSNVALATGPYPRILELVAKALRSNGYAVEGVDAAGGLISASSSIDGKTDGEQVQVVLRLKPDGHIEIVFRSSIKSFVFAFSKNQERMLGFFDSLVSTSNLI